MLEFCLISLTASECSPTVWLGAGRAPTSRLPGQAWVWGAQGHTPVAVIARLAALEVRATEHADLENLFSRNIADLVHHSESFHCLSPGSQGRGLERWHGPPGTADTQARLPLQ